MADPFTRDDARRRAEMARNTAETWRGVVRERTQFRDAYAADERRDDAVAATWCTLVAEREVAFHLSQARAYDRIARGENPFTRLDDMCRVDGAEDARHV